MGTVQVDMDLRDGTPEDVEAIRAVAHASLTESYGDVVDEDLLEDAIDGWYDTAELAEDIVAPRVVFPLAVEDGDVVGFAESYVVEHVRERVGEIDWLHVHPDYRGKGIGSDLLARVETELRDADVDRIEGRVLVANEAGTEFYEQEGYDRSEDRTITVGRETFRERRYVKDLTAEPETPETAVHTTPGGERVYVAFDESDRGSDGPFYAVYLDEEHEVLYGYFCGNCEGLDTAVDTMDRIECNNCGNRRKPTRWDAAYL